MGIGYRMLRKVGHSSKPHQTAKPHSTSHTGGLAGGLRGPGTKPSPLTPATSSRPRSADDIAQEREVREWAAQGWQVAPRPTKDDAAIDDEPRAPAPALTADRPATITDMVGQDELRNQLGIVVEGARARGTRVPHVLLTGPAGHGKTTLAQILAGECGAAFMQSTGVMLRKPTDLSGLLLKMDPNVVTVVFIDEVHRTPLPVMEGLYEALEDGKLSVIAGHGVDAQAIVHDLAPFICVAATTDPGRLSTPFRERFGFRGNVVPYSTDELGEIVRRAWSRRDVTFADNEPDEVAKRCKGVPRLVLHLADRVLDYCAVHGLGEVEGGIVAEALSAFGIDEQGLNSLDWRVLDALVNTFSGRPVGLDALASALDVDARTLSAEIEPPLAQAGLIQRTKAGRMALPAAYELFRKDSTNPWEEQ